MNIPDLINGAFEASGGFFIMNHARILYKDKTVRGVSLVSNLFFLIWGIWNIYYYRHLEQIISLYGGLFLTISGIVWNSMIIYYLMKERSNARN